jgi:hypothetical protein
MQNTCLIKGCLILCMKLTGGISLTIGLQEGILRRAIHATRGVLNPRSPARLSHESLFFSNAGRRRDHE